MKKETNFTKLSNIYIKVEDKTNILYRCLL